MIIKYAAPCVKCGQYFDILLSEFIIGSTVRSKCIFCGKITYQTIYNDFTEMGNIKIYLDEAEEFTVCLFS